MNKYIKSLIRELKVPVGCLGIAFILFCVMILVKFPELPKLLIGLNNADTTSVSWKSVLPPNATEIKEWSWAEGFLPDYSYILKAKITQTEFQEFCTNLELTLHTPIRKYPSSESGEIPVNWGAPHGLEHDWWNPTDSLDDTFVSHSERGDTWSYAKFENGYLFFQSHDS